MTLNLELIAVSCIAHQGRLKLTDAIFQDWKICKTCNSILCPDCVLQFTEQNNGICPSYILGIERHEMDLQNISTDEIVLFAQRKIRTNITGQFIQRIFYDENLLKCEPLLLVGDQTSSGEVFEENIVMREEFWSRFGVILIKRRRGKFVTWEKL